MHSYDYIRGIETKKGGSPLPIPLLGIILLSKELKREARLVSFLRVAGNEMIKSKLVLLVVLLGLDYN